jgi:hypothetical protein
MSSGLAPTGEGLALAALIAGNTYVALFVGTPGTQPSSGEVSGGAYARVQVTAWTTAGSNPTVGSNTNVLTFAQASAGWGTVNQFAIFDALTVGNMRGWGDLAAAKTINLNDTARFAAGVLTISVT